MDEPLFTIIDAIIHHYSSLLTTIYPDVWDDYQLLTDYILLVNI